MQLQRTKATRTGSTGQWRELRARVLIRDGFECQRKRDGCRRWADLQADHRVAEITSARISPAPSSNCTAVARRDGSERRRASRRASYGLLRRLDGSEPVGRERGDGTRAEEHADDG